MLEAIIKRLKRDRRGVSNVIVVMLSLILVVVIVANVVLWSYQMNQFDWERMHEDVEVVDVDRVTDSSWFTAQSEYTVNTGSRINGSYEDTQVADDGRWESFREGQPPIASSTVGTDSRSSAIRYPYQRKAFYANGRFWVFYSDGSNLVYRTSTDGATWSDATTVRATSYYGYYFSVWFDGTYVHYVCARGYMGEALFYRRGTANADGTITWSATEQQAAEAVPTVTYYRRQAWAEGNLWVMDGSYSATSNYTTEIVTGTTSAGNYYYINPFTYHTIPNGTNLPTNILLQGWRTSIPVTLKDSRYAVYGTVRNRDASSHAGRLYARLWKSQYSNMSGGVAISSWQYGSVYFTATAGQERYFYIPLSIVNPPSNEYLYVEFAWYISTSSSSATAGLYLRAETYYSFVMQYGWAYYYPYVSVDSSGCASVAYRRYNYYSYPYVTKSSLNNGTWQTASGFPYQLHTSSSWYWRLSILPLTEGKAYVLYNNRYETYGRLWNGSTWESQETVTTTDLQDSSYFSAVTEGGDVHYVFLRSGTYDILYRKRTYGTGWDAEFSVQSSTTYSSAPVLSINTANNDLYVFWAGSPTANHVYYKKNSGGVWDTLPNDWIDESSEVLTGNDRLTSYYKDAEGRIALIYMTKTMMPYNVKHKYLSWTLDLNGTFAIDTSTYPLTYIETIKIQLRYRASDLGEKWYLEAYNWTSATYSDNGFNIATGHTPTTGWDYYTVNLTDQWRSYVREDGTMYIKLHDEGRDFNQTTIEIDFLGISATIDGARFTFKNAGSSTVHLVSLWITNSTNHKRYDINIFINSGETLSYPRVDISLPSEQYVVKVVTERGNVAIYSNT